ncbi:unnamed protein product, partial [Brassica rapa]
MVMVLKAHNKAILIWTSPDEIIIQHPLLVIVVISSCTRLRFDQSLKFRNRNIPHSPPWNHLIKSK